MKTYVLYHANCPDGTGAALAAYLKLGDHWGVLGQSFPVEYIPVRYGEPPPEFEPGSLVYILDFSYSAKVLLEFAGPLEEVCVLDHHSTAQADLSEAALLEAAGMTRADLRPSTEPGNGFNRVRNVHVKFDMTKSGAVLAWEYFHPNVAIPELLLYVQDRDLWQFRLPYSREVSAALGSYPMHFLLWKDLACLGTNVIAEAGAMDALKSEGITCLRLKNQQVENMAKAHRWALFDIPKREVVFMSQPGISELDEGWLYAPVANATVFFSEVGEKLLKMYPDAPFSAYYSDRADGKRQWGLRSRPDFDCSVIAKAFGGGGHKQASGFVQDEK